MARFSAAFQTSAGSATLPIGSLYSVATCRPILVEVGVFNTTSTAVTLNVVRLTTTGTQGATVTASYEDDDSQTVLSTAKQTHTVAPTLGAVLRTATLGAAVGSGMVWTFGTGRRTGLVIPAATTAGIGVIPTGTGQVCSLYFVWDE